MKQPWRILIINLQKSTPFYHIRINHYRTTHNKTLYLSYGHYNDVMMSAMASQITSFTIYSTVCSGVDQRKHKSSASLAFVRGIHRWPVNSPHKWPVTRKMFPFDDVTMNFILIGTHHDTTIHDCMNGYIHKVVLFKLITLNTDACDLPSWRYVIKLSIKQHNTNILTAICHNHFM